jgi:hypothetical protein
MRNDNVVSIDQARRTAAQGRQARQQRPETTAPLLKFSEAPAPFALSAEAIACAERIELLIAAGRPLATLDAMLSHLERRSA